MRRKIFTSRGMALLAKKSTNKRVEIYSFFPIDKANCKCHGMIRGWKEKLASMPEGKRSEIIEQTGHLVCPRDKTGMRRYGVICKACGEILGYCWATDNTLRDWCDFHYVNWTEGEEWHGCLTPHISPITEQLCLECCCGEDTRDFRANMTLSAKNAFRIEEKNKVGREFGKFDSKFLTRVVSKDIIAFKEIKIG